MRQHGAKTFRLPEAFSEGGALLEQMKRSGVVPKVAERVRVRRQGGYSGVDAVLFLLLYFSAQLRGGLGSLWASLGEHAQHVGALANRSSLMSASALSRLLGRVTLDEIHAFDLWLLLEASGAMEVMKKSAARFYTGRGRPVRVFAFDPVRNAIRHRSLPKGEDLPPAVRRSGELGASGHTGRKRGEVIYTVGMVEDLASTMVLAVYVEPGTGSRRDQFAHALDTVVRTQQTLDERLEDAILIADGEFGNFPHLAQSVDKGVPVLTRCSRYHLLDEPGIRSAISSSRWERVSDTRSGPQRWAADVGMIRLHASHTTKQDDGSRFEEPVEVRLVVSRYTIKGADDDGRGHLIGQDRYELFVCHGVSREDFSAADVVTLFYARASQECSFEQHQRDLSVQQVYSFQPDGQLFALVVAFFLWNYRLAGALAFAPDLPDHAPPVARQAETAEPVPLPPVEKAAPPKVRANASDTGSAPQEAQGASDTGPEPPVTPAELPDAADQTAEAIAGEALTNLLNGLPWEELLAKRPGWSWNAGAQRLVKSDGVALPLGSVSYGTTSASVRFAETRDQRQIQATIAIPMALGAQIEAALRSAHPKGRRPVARSPATEEKKPKRRRERELPPPLIEPFGDIASPPFAIGFPQLVAAAARKLFRARVASVQIEIRTGHTPPVRRGHPLLADSRARRTRRRLSWDEHLDRYAARANTRIRIIVPSDEVRAWYLKPPPYIDRPRRTT